MSDDRPRYPRFVIDVDPDSYVGDDDDGEVTRPGMYVTLQADEGTSIIVIPPQYEPPPPPTPGNYAIAVDAIRQWCMGRPYTIDGEPPSFDEMMADDAVINLLDPMVTR